MKKIKTITQSDPTFLKTTYYYDNLVNLVNHERFVNPAEKYIIYQAKAWAVYRMGRDRVPRYCGKYDNIIQAVRVAHI
jgi:hypothetical protein